MRDGRLLILGNGGAGLSAAASARASGYAGQIHLASDVGGPAFNPMLAPYFLKGAMPWERCFPFGQEFYHTFGITLHGSAAAASLDAVNREVSLADGQKLAYDKCLIATGASPVIPSIPGLPDSSRAFALRTAASVRSLGEALSRAETALVLGASFLGLKVAEILLKRRVRVILLDVGDQLLPRGAHRASAAFLKAYFEQNGADVRLGCTMDSMEGEESGAACHFTDNVKARVDLVVVCAGVRPNLGFVDPRQVKTGEAVLVDGRMEASAPDLYAAGDASEGINLLSGRHEWLGTWENACLQGRIAGENMAGRNASYPGSIPQNIGPFFEWTYAQVGDIGQEGGLVRYVMLGDPEPEKGGFLVLAFREETLVGANLLNCTHLAGTLRRAILEKWPMRPHLRGSLSIRGVERVLGQASDDLWGRVIRAPS